MSSWLFGDGGERIVLWPGFLGGIELRGGEKQALSDVILTTGGAKYQSVTAGHDKDSPLQDQTLTTLIRSQTEKKKRGIRLKC